MTRFKLKTILSFVILGVFVVYMYRNMVSESRYVCTGTDGGNVNSTQKLYLKLQTYRFPATIWASHDGNVMIEFSDGTLEYINDVRSIDVAYQFYTSGVLKGQLSTLGNKLMLRTSAGVFEGACEVMQ